MEKSSWKTLICANAHDLVAYLREGDTRILMAANWSAGEKTMEIPEGFAGILLNNYPDLERETPAVLRLKPFQCVVLS